MPFEYLKNVSYEDIDLLETKYNIIVQDKGTLGEKNVYENNVTHVKTGYQLWFP